MPLAKTYGPIRFFFPQNVFLGRECVTETGFHVSQAGPSADYVAEMTLHFRFPSSTSQVWGLRHVLPWLPFKREHQSNGTSAPKPQHE